MVAIGLSERPVHGDLPDAPLETGRLVQIGKAIGVLQHDRDVQLERADVSWHWRWRWGVSSTDRGARLAGLDFFYGACDSRGTAPDAVCFVAVRGSGPRTVHQQQHAAISRSAAVREQQRGPPHVQQQQTARHAFHHRCPPERSPVIACRSPMVANVYSRRQIGDGPLCHRLGGQYHLAYAVKPLVQSDPVVTVSPRAEFRPEPPLRVGLSRHCGSPLRRRVARGVEIRPAHLPEPNVAAVLVQMDHVRRHQVTHVGAGDHVPPLACPGPRQ